jgi:hypothetical protein
LPDEQLKRRPLKFQVLITVGIIIFSYGSLKMLFFLQRCTQRTRYKNRFLNGEYCPATANRTGLYYIHSTIHLGSSPGEKTMQTLNFSEIREQRLVNTMEKVCNDHQPVVITRRDGQPVVMLALDDYEALANNHCEPQHEPSP